jgi:hypothetical protein
MSTSTASVTSSPSPTDTSSNSSNSSQDDDIADGVQYYNYFFLLLAVAFVILFLLLLYFQRRRKLKNARIQQHGRAALVQDVESWPSDGLWSWRAPENPSRRLNRAQSACNDSILETGLDERGEAPPPYNTAAADKAPPMPRTGAIRLTDAEGLTMREIPTGPRLLTRLSPRMLRMAGLPPDYYETGGVGEAADAPARPAPVVTVAERLSEVEVEEPPPSAVHPSRIPPNVTGRGDSMRRLMSSTESTV